MLIHMSIFESEYVNFNICLIKNSVALTFNVKFNLKSQL